MYLYSVHIHWLCTDTLKKSKFILFADDVQIDVESNISNVNENIQKKMIIEGMLKTLPWIMGLESI